jgi:hypothetical protein
MNENTKRTLITIGAILALCCFVSLMAGVVILGLGKEVDKRINFGTEDQAQAVENIAIVDIPAGYQIESGMSLLVFDMATITPINNKALPTIMLVQFSKYTSINLERIDIQSGDSLPVVDTFQITIRGKETTITVREDARLRQWTAVFEGKAGSALFLAEGPILGWDEKLLMDFLKSIR